MRKYLVRLLILAAAVGVALWALQPKEPPLATSGPKLGATLVRQWDNQGSPARQAAFSPDGRWLATSNAAGEVRILDTIEWHAVRQLTVPGGATSLTFTLDAGQLITAGYDGVVRSWRLSDGKIARQYAGASGPVWAISLRPDGKELAAAGEDKAIWLWSLETGKARTLKGHERNIWATSYTPDGKALASGSFDKSVRIWREGAVEPQILNGHRQAVVGLDISPDGRLMATSGDDSTLRFWKMPEGKPLRVIDAGNHTYDVEFSPDGRWLVTSGRARGAPGTFLHQLTGLGVNATPVHLWRVSDGAAVAALPHGDDVMYAAFSPDQRYLVTSGEDAVRLWRLEAR